MQVGSGATRHSEILRDRESIGDLLGQLANDSAALIRDQMELAKQELKEKLKELRVFAIVIAAGATVALLGVSVLCAAAVIALTRYVGPGYAALIVGGVLTLAGGIVVLTAVSRLQRTKLTPELTIETLQEDKEWLKRLT
jgi:uncharacterized membrane protein YqjE